MKQFSIILLCSFIFFTACSQTNKEEALKTKALSLNHQAADLILHGQDSAALVVLNKSIALDSTIIHNYGMKANILHNYGREQEALTMLLEAEHFFEKDGLFAMNIAWSYAQLGDSIQALKKLAQASERYQNYFKGKSDSRHVIDAVSIEWILNGKEAGKSLFYELSSKYPQATQDTLKELYKYIEAYDDSTFSAKFWNTKVTKHITID